MVGIPLETEKVELSFSQSKFGRRYRRFLVQALIEANACRWNVRLRRLHQNVQRRSEYIAEPGDIEKVEEPVTIRRRRAR